MSTKIITLDQRFSTGEPTVQLVVSPGRDGRMLRETTSLHMSKTASQSPAMDYIRTVEPEPGKSIVLVIGLGDHETYGPNRNGDGFNSEPVPGKIASDQVLTKHYQSYDNAHVFEHHVNHDPAKAIGRVKKAFWNPFMHRVEVLEDFEHAKAPHLLEKIASGEYPSKSMGCKIPYDVCTICGNRAPTRKEYCDHLKYEMNRIDSQTGKQAAALNPSPRFFDSSWVMRPADRTGHMLKKVAYDSPYEIRMASYELSERVEDARDKAAALGKAADMEKVISGSPEASVSSTDKGTLALVKRYSDTSAPADAASVPKADVRITIEYTPDEAIGTSDAMGLPMGLRELVQFFMGRMDREASASPAELDSACKHAEAVLELFAQYPRFYDDALKLAGINAPRVNDKLANTMWPPATMVGDRTLVDTPLQDRRLPSGQVRAQTPNTDVLTFTDPTGRTGRTNMGLARKATHALEGDAQSSKATRGMGYLGMGTLLGGAGMGALMTGKRTAMRNAMGLLGVAGGAAAGAKGLHEAVRPVRMGDLRSPMVMTNEGQIIPAATEMKMGAWHPEMIYTALRHRDGAAACASIPSQRKLSFLKAARTAEVYDELSPVLGPTLDPEKVALLLEQSISALA